MAIATGQKAPDFTLKDQDGKEFQLSKQSEPVLLVFYPGDDTPVCTAQLCDYRDGIDTFKGLGVEVIGISKDDAQSHIKFREKYNLPFQLLSDPDLSVAKQYDCVNFMKGMKRAVFLVDTDQVIQYAHIEGLAVFKRSKEELLAVIEKLKENGVLVGHRP